MKFLLATSGASGVELVQHVPTDGTPTSEIVKIVIQVVIGIATLIGMFKKPKNQ